MSKLYTSIPAPRVPRNTFDRSRPNTLSMHFQRCVPTALEEIYPGDLFSVGSETFARLMPLTAPVMNNMKISNHAFFVPLRTLNSHFAEFMFNNRTGDYAEVLPYTYTDVLYNIVDKLYNDVGKDTVAVEVIRLLDYIGLPFKYESKAASTPQSFIEDWLDDTWNKALAAYPKRVNLAPFFGYTKIWSEYFRDENLTDDPFEYFEDTFSQDVKDWTGDVSNKLWDSVQQDVTQYTVGFAECFLQLRPRAWAHDRFTSSLPFAQRGPDVLLPIAGTADVMLKDGYPSSTDIPGNDKNQIVRVLADGNPPQIRTGVLTKQSSTNYSYIGPTGLASLAAGSPAALDPNGSMYVDMSEAALTTTINDFRRAERLQRWYENSARGGIRPNESTLAHFGVRTPDATLDRSEFLGGYMQPLVISEVAQTSQTTNGTDGSPQGTLAGKGTSYKGSRLFRHYFTEHGFMFVFTSAIVRANYWQGIPKVFSRMQRDEYYWPEFANLGEEPVYTKELYAANPAGEDEVFGYVPRYSDLKSAQGEVHGDMRSTLDFWTQTREFANTPALNTEFIYGPAPLSPFAVQSQYSDPIVATIQYNIKASRLMPFYGVPTI